MKKIKMGVVGFDSNGAPSIFTTVVRCTGGQFKNGLHYDLAKEKASKRGFEPLMAFDEEDPAARYLDQDCRFFHGKPALEGKKTTVKGVQITFADTAYAQVPQGVLDEAASFSYAKGHAVSIHIDNALREIEKEEVAEETSVEILTLKAICEAAGSAGAEDLVLSLKPFKTERRKNE